MISLSLSFGRLAVTSTPSYPLHHSLPLLTRVFLQSFSLVIRNIFPFCPLQRGYFSAKKVFRSTPCWPTTFPSYTKSPRSALIQIFMHLLLCVGIYTFFAFSLGLSLLFPTLIVVVVVACCVAGWWYLYSPFYQCRPTRCCCQPSSLSKPGRAQGMC